MAFLRDWQGLLGVAILALFIVAAVLAPQVAPREPDRLDVVRRSLRLPGKRAARPAISWAPTSSAATF